MKPEPTVAQVVNALSRFCYLFSMIGNNHKSVAMPSLLEASDALGKAATLLAEAYGVDHVEITDTNLRESTEYPEAEDLEVLSITSLHFNKVETMKAIATPVEQPVVTPPVKIAINFDQLQTADNGDTTHYGGTITVNGEEIQAHGTDRDYNLQYSIQAKIESLINRKLTDNEYEKFEDKFCDLENFEIELN